MNARQSLGRNRQREHLLLAIEEFEPRDTRLTDFALLVINCDIAVASRIDPWICWRMDRSGHRRNLCFSSAIGSQRFWQKRRCRASNSEKNAPGIAPGAWRLFCVRVLLTLGETRYWRRPLCLSR